MTSAPQLSVILPTYNPAPEMLLRTLQGLAGQTLAGNAWEMIVVDNASLPPLAASTYASILPGLRVVRETSLGLSNARAAGIAAAQGQVIVFVDDDNVLEPDYLQRVRDFFDAHAEVGAAGGKILPEFAQAPPPWAEAHFTLLALRDLGEQVLISSHTGGPVTAYESYAPFGAGMAVRSHLARAFAEWQRTSPLALSDRKGNALGACGDCEIVVYALQAGFQIAYVPTLRLTHLIPARRLTFAYLARLNYEGSISWSQFRVRNGLARRIPAWTIWPRTLRSFFVQRAWTRSGYIRWRGAHGQFEGFSKG